MNLVRPEIIPPWLMGHVASELVIAVPLLAPGGLRARRIAAVCLAQLATHPLVWFIWPLLGLSRPVFLSVAEGFALFVEALIYRFSFERLARVTLLRGVRAGKRAYRSSLGFGSIEALLHV